MTQTESDFLKTVVPAAMQSEAMTGIPASITIAQAILESGWGASELAKQANNYFGIKAPTGATPDQYVEFKTAEFVDGRAVEEMAKFVRFRSIQDSFLAHATLIAIDKRYAPAMAQCHDPAAFAAALQACGYSTNPNYAHELMSLVAEFQITQYDMHYGGVVQSPVQASPAPSPGVPATPQVLEVPAAPAKEQQMGSKVLTFLSWFGHEFAKGYSLFEQYEPPAAALAGIIFPPAEAALAGVQAAVKLVQSTVVSIEQKYAASGAQDGSGSSKLGDVIAITEPAVLQLLAKEGVKADTSKVTEITNVVVALLNAKQPPAA